MTQVEDKMFKANQTSLKLLKDLKDAENELETLKSYVIDLKSKVAIYVPAKDDPVDKKLADFINNYPDRNKLKIMFFRESEGVYSFGSKKIRIKVLNN
jgi:esterase/lipase